MRILHTADWHLGRTLHGLRLIEDQSYVLDQVVRIADDEQVDVVIISGDVYDRSVPPPDAVSLLDHVLDRLINDLKIKVIIIAGNHDSPERIGFGSRVFDQAGLYVIGPVCAQPDPIELEDAFGPVFLYPIPYADPVRVREILGNEEIIGHDKALRALLDRARAAAPRGRRVAVAHAFVVGGMSSDSERPLSVGGAGSVAADAFDGFAYVALGHLHRPQSPMEHLRYAGSLMTYSFSEIGHNKSVTIAELDGGRGCSVEEILLQPRRQVREIRGRLAEIIEAGRKDARKEDYLKVILEDRDATLDPMGKLRHIYPNVLHLERTIYAGQPGAIPASPQDRRALGDVELFESFFDEVVGEKVTLEQRKEIASVVDELHAEGEVEEL